jgi:hypothetical protein
VDGSEQQGVVGHQQVRAGVEHLVDDGGGRVDGEQHPPHRLVGITAHQADRVPGLGQRGVVAGVERGDHLAQGHWHGSGL